MNKLKSYISLIVICLATISLYGCATSSSKPQTHQPNLTNNSSYSAEENIKVNHKQVEIDQDEYIIEAIKRIEENKSKLGSTKRKEYIREYTYTASDADSKITARKNASTELKRVLLEEIGIHIRSSLQIDKQVDVDQRVRTEVNKAITTYTAGTVSMKTIEEKWNGKSFYIKGKMTIDPESVAEGIAEGLRAESERKTIAELQEIIDSQNHSLNKHSKELKSVHTQLSKNLLTTKAKENGLKELNNQLAIAKQKLATYEAEDRKIRNALEKVLNRISKQNNRVEEIFRQGMTREEIIQLAGNPNSSEDCLAISALSYGNYWLVLRSGISRKLISLNQFKGACHPDTNR